MLSAGDVGKAQVTLTGWRPSFCSNGGLDVGDGQWGDSRGTADF
jgi:hypothetical protein